MADQALLIVHYLALAVGLGGGIAAGVVAHVAGPKDPALAGAVQVRLARFGFLALIVLWLTGSAMLAGGPGAAALPVWFWVKMAAVVVLTGAAVWMQIAIKKLEPAQRAARAKVLRPVMNAAATLAVVFAVLAFG
ncbi:CopD family protein [Roseovarius salinarum]|uniref:CopD family protein n=1 Tax=Roseovarius salinarum TaxID=1981892 RepID=UPI0012FFF5F9|nr:CopD family protein [Roseovarius salinarum]